MANPDSSARAATLLRFIDPRRSLVAGAVWLIVALVATFSVAAAVWVGGIARQTVLEQHIRRLLLETDQLGSDVSQALAARLDAVRAADRLLHTNEVNGRPGELGDVFNELLTAYPQLDWMAIADSRGTVIGTTGALRPGSDARMSRWFLAGLDGPWVGAVDDGARVLPAPAAISSALGDVSMPVRDTDGHAVGVVAAHLSWRRSAHHPQRLTDEAQVRGATQAFLLDHDGIVLAGPPDLWGKAWNGMPTTTTELSRSAAGPLGLKGGAPQFEQLPDGRAVLVARVPLGSSAEISALRWQVQLSEPNDRAYQRADAVAIRILWVSLCLGILTASLGTLGARHLTRRLRKLTLSVTQVGQDETASIEVPAGVDEVARLGAAFARILGDLQQERRELERRVAIRTHEVQRLAEESRYAAIVRERLTIARDLHDTLAHSMMAILSEIRLLRRLHARDPTALASELAHAEDVAHQGLTEARSAIMLMRMTAVRETGLGPALAGNFEKFVDRTGLCGKFNTDSEAASFGDERGEALLRIAQEALRNIEKHARATHVDASLRIVAGAQLELRIHDNGIGFDPEAQLRGHFGLVGLREQAELIGAMLRMDSGPNAGTTIVVTLPLSPVAFNRPDLSK